LHHFTLNKLYMKSGELNKLILQNGWIAIRQRGSHITYEKEGIRYTATFHGSKEVGTGLASKIIKEMNLK